MKLRRPKNSRAGQVLIILAGTLLLGGSALIAGTYLTGKDIDEIDDAVKEHVDDKARKKAARSVLKDWKKEAKDFEKRTSKRRKAAIKLLRSRDGDRAELDRMVREMDADTDATWQLLLDKRFELRGELTEVEWREVFLELE